MYLLYAALGGILLSALLVVLVILLQHTAMYVSVGLGKGHFNLLGIVVGWGRMWGDR
jgi:hypothetical protein